MVFILLYLQPDIPFLPVFASMKRLLRYNVGSIAVGSLLLSFVESIRFILESIRRKLKVSYTTPDNWFGKVVHHSTKFCLKCVEWTIKSVNRNAYIMVSEFKPFFVNLFMNKIPAVYFLSRILFADCHNG